MIQTAVLAGMAALGMAAPAPPLSAYTGGYPSERVHGYSFWRNPTVRRATRAAVARAAIRRDVLTWAVEDKVKDTAGMSLAWGCEAHDCANHNGTIVVVRPRGPAAVCFHDADHGADVSRWYIAGKLVSTIGGTCPSDVAPSDIAAALKRH